MKSSSDKCSVPNCSCALWYAEHSEYRPRRRTQFTKRSKRAFGGVLITVAYVLIMVLAIGTLVLSL